MSRISGITDAETLQAWALEVTPDAAPAVVTGIAEGRWVRVGDLYRNPHDRDQRLPCIALLIKRGAEEILLPDDGPIETGDRILLCGRFGTAPQVEWLARNHNVFDYLCTGEQRASGYLWRLFTRRSEPA